jgi:hypothetical protein
MRTDECEICGLLLNRENSAFGWGRCKEHWKCDDCGTREEVCMYTEALLCEACHAKRVEKRVKAFNKKTFCTDEITCPWCGFEYTDSWERESGEGEEECQDCNRKFTFSRHTAVTYCTLKQI